MSFPVILASKKSISKRRLVHGHGINDADYTVKPIIDGERFCCPYYTVWVNMLKRVFSKKYHTMKPTYSKCEIDESWLKFSNFKKWMESQDWKGKSLDKDMLIQGNKKYGPENCVFVSKELNNLMIICEATRGDHPQGVDFVKARQKFRAQINFDGKKKGLGYFDAVEQAESEYRSAKAVIFARAALKQRNPRIYSALIQRAHKLNKMDINI